MTTFGYLKKKTLQPLRSFEVITAHQSKSASNLTGMQSCAIVLLNKPSKIIMSRTIRGSSMTNVSMDGGGKLGSYSGRLIETKQVENQSSVS